MIPSGLPQGDLGANSSLDVLCLVAKSAIMTYSQVYAEPHQLLTDRILNRVEVPNMLLVQVWGGGWVHAD
jgi:hypothetical protein